MRPTIDELKSLWLHAYSRSALIQARLYVEEMEKFQPTSVAFRALICATVVTYARPFTTSRVSESKQIIPLRGISPPHELALSHSNLLSLRNKVIGHVDVLPARGHVETPNKVLIVRDNTGFNLHTLLTADIAKSERDNIAKLCAFFVDYCDKQLNNLIKKIGNDFPVRPGVYKVLINEPPKNWIEPFAPVVTTD
jgi:hypothetical protein